MEALRDCKYQVQEESKSNEKTVADDDVKVEDKCTSDNDIRIRMKQLNSISLNPKPLL